MTRSAPVFLLALGFLLPAPVRAQDPEARRAQLEAEVFERFLNRTAEELQLDESGRARLEKTLRQAGQRRRELGGQWRDLRQHLIEAVRDSSTSEAEFTRLLNELTALRARDYELWRDEQKALADVLNPRQRAQFAVLFLRFNERLQEMRFRRAGPGDRPVAPFRRPDGLQRPPRRP